MEIYSLVGPNRRKSRLERTPYLDTFQAMLRTRKLSEIFRVLTVNVLVSEVNMSLE